MEMKRMGMGFSGQKNSFLIFCFMLGFCLMLSSCYHRHSAKRQQHAALVEYSDKQLDSISFSSTLVLIKQQPEEYVNHLQIDSFSVKKNCLLVVSDIRMIPQDSIDSVWVQLATEENQFGWVHESKMLPKVVPDDPISQFISFFSNVHLLVFSPQPSMPPSRPICLRCGDISISILRSIPLPCLGYWASSSLPFGRY